jgi:hypothetical protein
MKPSLLLVAVLAFFLASCAAISDSMSDSMSKPVGLREGSEAGRKGHDASSEAAWND